MPRTASSTTKKRPMLVDDPGAFDTLATWERHLTDLKKLPKDILGKAGMIKTAKEIIAWKRKG